MLAASTGKKAIIVFGYDGVTLGGDSKAATDVAKANGIQIYGLGPETRRADLTRWVSAPKDFFLCANVGSESMAATFDLAGDRLLKANTQGHTEKCGGTGLQDPAHRQ